MLDQQSDGPAIDVITGEIARAARGNDFRIELGLSATIQDINTLYDVSNLTLLTFVLKDPNNLGGLPPIPPKSVSLFNTTLTPEAWNAGNDQHALIQYSASETLPDLGGQPEKTFYWSVRATTNLGKSVTAGSGLLTIYDDGQSGQPEPIPPVGSSLVPSGTLYSGGGSYVLTGLTAGTYYSWEKGANDTDLVNGGETLTSTGWFLAQGPTVTLHGTASALITALVRWPRIYTAVEVDAKFAGTLKIINDPGVLIGMRSPNGLILRLEGVGDDANPITKIIDLSTL